MSINCMQEKDDIELLYMSRGGNMKAFECLFNKYHKKAFNISFKTTGSTEMAEDIVMDAFLKIYTSHFRIKSGFSSYFYKIVINMSINHIKKSKKILTDIDFELFVSNLNEPSEEFFKKEHIKKAWKALNSIPISQKTAFILIKYEEMTYKETAEIMGISVKALESLMTRAKENLKKYYLGGEK